MVSKRRRLRTGNSGHGGAAVRTGVESVALSSSRRTGQRRFRIEKGIVRAGGDAKRVGFVCMGSAVAILVQCLTPDWHGYVYGRDPRPGSAPSYVRLQVRATVFVAPSGGVRLVRTCSEWSRRR